jgi:hypothetical protein
MRLELELQYAEFHPDQVEKVGQVDLERALKIIHSYPWDREFEKIEERTKEDLTSTVPNVSIKNRDKETLIVSARDKNNFIIEFLTLTHRGEQIIPINSYDNKQGITTEGIVTMFYEGTIKNVLKLKPLPPATATDTRVYKLKEYPVFMSGLTFGILALILIIDFWSNGLTSKALPGVYFVGLVILMISVDAILTIQYILNDWGKDVSFENEDLLIRQKGKQIKLTKSEIEQIAVIENDGSRHLRNYKYARIKTKDGKVFIVTSFIMDPMDIVNKLKVNHKEESVFFLPTINRSLQSEKQKQKLKRDREKKKIEFLDHFKDFDDSKLRQIAGDKKGYADYAVDAATEILERRKKFT